MKEDLIQEFDKLQKKFGSATCNSVYGGGKDNNPDLCLVFMNPTAKNIATSKDWKGIRSQWLGTKQVWKFLTDVGLFDKDLNNQIQNMKPKNWSPKFCEEVYGEVARQKVYITNLAKCTQDDARPLPDKVFKEYRDFLLEEIKKFDLKNIELKECSFYPQTWSDMTRNTAQYQRMRKTFLKLIGYSDQKECKEIGFDEEDIELLKNKKSPENYNTHIKIPLEFGGKLDMENLCLIKTHPLHDQIHRLIEQQISCGFLQRYNFIYIPWFSGKFYHD